jgi:hypothetical protein
MGKAALVRFALARSAARSVAFLASGWGCGCVGMGLGAVLAPSIAHAADTATPASTAPSATDRSGVVVGFAAGYGLAGASGFPNEASKIDDPAYYSSSDLLSGGGGSGFLMGALTDYVSFGFWAGASTFQSGHWRSTGGGGGVRLELFPLYGIYPRLKNLGILTQVGFGVSRLTSKVGDFPSANGSQSYASAGVFYEVPLFKMIGGHFALGPSLEYASIFSPAYERHWAMLGLRVAFYGGS